MRLILFAAALCFSTALAQTPPTPDAVLIAGASPAVTHATEVAMHPQSIALAPDGTLYVADTRRIWRVDLEGVLTAIPGSWDTGSQGLNIITAIATDAAGNLFVTEWLQHRIWKLTPDGAVTTFAELGDRVALALAADSRGNIFFSETAHVTKVSPDGAILLFAGNGLATPPQSPTVPVPALQYSLLSPGRLAIDEAGTVYINDASAILQVTPDGMLQQLRGRGGPNMTALAVDVAGNLYAGLQGQVARVLSDGSLQTILGGTDDALHSPSDLAADAAGNLYVADPLGGRVRQIRRDRSVHVVAGGDGGSFGGDGGAAVNAFLAGPAALTFDAAGNLYFADSHNHRVRRIDPAGIIQTVASGLALTESSGIAADPDGNLYISDTGNRRVLKLAADGALTTFAASDAPAGLAFGFSNLYIAETERIRYVTGDGVIDTFYGPLPNAGGIALDSAGNVFVGTFASTVELASGGHVFVLPGAPAVPNGIAIGPSVEVYSAGPGGSIARVDPSCALTLLAAADNRDFRGIAVAPNGDLYVADTSANRIWRIPARESKGTVPIALLAPASVWNGATLRPRTISKTVRTRFGETTIFESANEDVAPGELVSIAGQCLGPLRFSQGPISEVRVTFNGVPAPLLSATPNQLIVQVPYETAGAASVRVEVDYGGRGTGVDLNTAAASVGIFPVPSPVYARGATVSLRITGAGQTDPPAITGQLAGDPGARPSAPVQVTVGGVAATVLAAATEPGTIGITRVTFRIPEELNAGPSSIEVMVGSSSDRIPVSLY